MGYTEIRKLFLSYYTELNFTSLPRAKMLHPSIPMSFVMSAGLVQIESSLKKGKLREGDKYVLIQDCFRHFDKKRVAKEPNHLSLFEMSGAFEFGQFNQIDVMSKLWDLIVNHIKVDPDRIWASYYEGGFIGRDYVNRDEKSLLAWQKLGIDPKQIIALSKEDNFWMQGGDTLEGEHHKRKCGTNSELFFDKGEHFKCSNSCKPGCRCGRFIEFANVLFVQYEFLEKSERLLTLDLPFAETVIGNERVAMIRQDESNVFDISSYADLHGFVRSFIQEKQLSDEFIYENVNIILDHLRAINILVMDGAPPPGRGGRAHIMKGLIRGVLARLIVLGIPFDCFIETALDQIKKTFSNSIGYEDSNKQNMIDFFKWMLNASIKHCEPAKNTSEIF